MFNHVIFKGNLVDNVRTSQNAQGSLSAFGKVAVYNGKDKNGQERDAMFFDIVTFGRNAEILNNLGQKGTPVVVSGRLEEDTSVSQKNGQTYVNKRIICDSVSVCVRPQQNAAPQQYQAPAQNAASPW